MTKIDPTPLIAEAQARETALEKMKAENDALRADKELLHKALGEASKTIVETKANVEKLLEALRWLESACTYRGMQGAPIQNARAVIEQVEK